MKRLFNFLLFPFKLVFNLIKFIINDIEKDLITIKKLSTGEIPLVNSKIKELGRYLANTKSYIEIFQENWIMFLIIILAFCSGFVVASQKFEYICNDYIINDIYGDREQCLENCNMYSALHENNNETRKIIYFNFSQDVS